MNDVCTGCGEPNPPGTQFCLFCGIYLGWDEREAEGGEPTGPLLAPPNTPPPEGTADDPGPAATAASAAATGSASPTATVPLAAAPVPVTGSAPPAVAPGSAEPTSPAATSPVATSAHMCAGCGRDNDPGRRFCGHCGQVLAYGAPVRTPTRRRRRWWQRLLRSDSRIARRAYRRSLPPLYRWRRVGLGALLALLIGGGFAVIGRDPVGWGVDRWYDLTNRLEPVRDIAVRAEPEDAVIGDNGAAGLVDADPGSAWVTAWEPSDEAVACGAAPGGRVVLTFSETRVRGLRVITGVTDLSERPLQLIPSQLHVVLPDGTCRSVPLDRSTELQTVAFDSEVPVARLTISIGETVRSDDERVQDVAGLSELSLVARPSRGG